MVTNSDSEIKIEGIYPIKIREKRKMSAGIIINNQYILKPTELSSERILFIHSALNHLKANHFTDCETFILTTEEKPFTQIEGKNYILTNLYSEPGLSFDDREDLSVAINLLAGLHIAGQGFTPHKVSGDLEKYQCPYTIKNNLGDWIFLFQKHSKELKKFKKNACGSVDSFDRAYSRIADEYCNLAQQLTTDLEKSAYNKMVVSAKENGCLCHRDFSGHNTVKCFPRPIIINFNETAIELPVYDVANLMKKRLRKCNWSVEEAHFILNTYCKTRSISNEELQVLKILLLFPQKLWRITNKYYNSKKSRYEKTALSKLDEIIQEQIPLKNVVHSI